MWWKYPSIMSIILSRAKHLYLFLIHLYPFDEIRHAILCHYSRRRFYLYIKKSQSSICSFNWKNSLPKLKNHRMFVFYSTDVNIHSIQLKLCTVIWKDSEPEKLWFQWCITGHVWHLSHIARVRKLSPMPANANCREERRKKKVYWSRSRSEQSDCCTL